jgi:outer membrane receptor protein involved in Fe transport
MKTVTRCCMGLLLPTLAQLAGATGQLEEIVVTAELRETTLQRQAGSTSVVTGSDIRQRAAQHLEDLLNLAPNVNYASGASRARFYQIRGIGERSQFQEPLNPSIGLLIDGIDFSGLGTAGTLFDIAQVEILRGPQGTLHGANALAGLINIRSAAPTAEPEARLALSAADYATWSAGFSSSGPLAGPDLLYRVAASTYRSDGFIDNDFLARQDTNNRDETSLRGRLRWLAGENASLDATVLYSDIDNGYDAFSLDNTRHTLSDEPGQDRLESTALALDWQQALAGFDLEAALTAAVYATDYGYDEDWSYAGIHPWGYVSFDRYRRDRDSLSAQLRLLSNDSSRLWDDSTDWVAGLYYLANREELRRDYTYLPGPFSSHYDSDTLALFGQLDSRLTPRLTLVSGLRVEHRRTDYRDSNSVDFAPRRTLWGGRFALEYRPGEQRMLYASLSRGYRANGVNAEILASMEATDDPDILQRLSGVQEFDEEALLNYELGFKGSSADGTLQGRLALFYMDRIDQQVKGSFVVAQPDGGTSFIDYTSNAGGGKNYGAELELNWIPWADLELYANLGLLRSELENYVNADGADLSGREQAQAPSYQYAAGGRYDLGGGFYLRLDAEGRDSYYFSDRHAARSVAFDLLHARVGYDNGRWAAALWCRNLTDEDYYVRGFGSFGNDPRKGFVTEPYYQYGEPRMLGISAEYRFQ